MSASPKASAPPDAHPKAASPQPMLLQRVVALAILFFCAGYLWNAMSLSFGSASAPKAGFLPHIVGWAGTVLAAINLFMTFLPSHRNPEGDTSPVQALIFCAGLAIFPALWNWTGFSFACLATTFYLLKASGTRGWILPAILSVAVAGGLYVAFVLLLQIPLP